MEVTKFDYGFKNGQVYITYSEILKQARAKGNEDNITHRKVVIRKII